MTKIYIKSKKRSKKETASFSPRLRSTWVIREHAHSCFVSELSHQTNDSEFFFNYYLFVHGWVVSRVHVFLTHVLAYKAKQNTHTKSTTTLRPCIVLCASCLLARLFDYALVLSSRFSFSWLLCFII